MNSHLKIVHNNSTPLTPDLLKIESLGKWFEIDNKRIPVLQDVNFQVQQGEIVCILGRSGCGKTTLLNLLSGFLKLNTGSIKLADQKVDSPGPDRCVIFQEDALFPWLTVRENIAFGLNHQTIKKKQKDREVDRFIDLVGLNDFANYLPDQISGGMKQRVALARVLILKPKILLLDEPFAALDAQTREEMQNLLMELCCQQNHTVLFVTHDVEEAVLLADRILLFDSSSKGIRENLSCSLVRPRERYSRDFVNICTHIVSLLKEESGRRNV